MSENKEMPLKRREIWSRKGAPRRGAHKYPTNRR